MHDEPQFQTLRRIFEAALLRIDPYGMIKEWVRLNGSRLVIEFDAARHEADLSRFSRILVLGCGKASVRMARAVDMPYVRIMADTFHMNIEEPDGICGAIRRAGSDYLKHFHVADNNREPAGKGTLPWKEILSALREIGFDGTISFEPMPKGASPYDLRDNPVPRENLDSALRTGLEYLRLLDRLIIGS